MQEVYVIVKFWYNAELQVFEQRPVCIFDTEVSACDYAKYLNELNCIKTDCYKVFKTMYFSMY